MFPTKTTLAPFQCTRQSNQAIFCTTWDGMVPG
jgi:hypothetical protein